MTLIVRMLLGFTVVSTSFFLSGTFQHVGAQSAEEATKTSEQDLQEPSSEPAPEEPALQLELTPAGVDVVPSAPRTGHRYTLEEMELRVKRAKIGLWSTAGATVLGGVIIGTWWKCEDEPADEALLACGGVLVSGVSIGFSGAVGMIVTGALLGVRKRNLRELKQAHHERAGRVHWDLASSRVVF